MASQTIPDRSLEFPELLGWILEWAFAHGDATQALTGERSFKSAQPQHSRCDSCVCCTSRHHLRVRSCDACYISDEFGPRPSGTPRRSPIRVEAPRKSRCGHLVRGSCLDPRRLARVVSAAREGSTDSDVFRQPNRDQATGASPTIAVAVPRATDSSCRCALLQRRLCWKLSTPARKQGRSAAGFLNCNQAQ